MSDTTRDEISIDLDGSIDKAIAELRRLEKLYPNGRISLEEEHEYGETYARLKLHFTRPLEPVEIEAREIRDKRKRLHKMQDAARAYEVEGDKYPRRAEMEKLAEELGEFANPRAEVVIRDGKVIAFDYWGEMRTGIESMQQALRDAEQR